jgi:hypothetical protein
MIFGVLRYRFHVVPSVSHRRTSDDRIDEQQPSTRGSGPRPLRSQSSRTVGGGAACCLRRQAITAGPMPRGGAPKRVLLSIESALVRLQQCRGRSRLLCKRSTGLPDPKRTATGVLPERRLAVGSSARERSCLRLERGHPALPLRAGSDTARPRVAARLLCGQSGDAAGRRWRDRSPQEQSRCERQSTRLPLVHSRSHGGLRRRYRSWPRAVTRRRGAGVIATRRNQ